MDLHGSSRFEDMCRIVPLTRFVAQLAGLKSLESMTLTKSRHLQQIQPPSGILQQGDTTLKAWAL